MGTVGVIIRYSEDDETKIFTSEYVNFVTPQRWIREAYEYNVQLVVCPKKSGLIRGGSERLMNSVCPSTDEKFWFNQSGRRCFRRFAKVVCIEFAEMEFKHVGVA